MTVLLILMPGDEVRAQKIESASAAIRSTEVENYEEDYRVLKLKAFLGEYNSPLAKHSTTFIYFSDVYNLDWRVLPAITGVESTFGKNIPVQSYNAYGWANGKYKFSSWDASIYKVSKAMKEKYFDQGLNTTRKISRVYAPPSNSWAWKVDYFVEKIDPISLEFDL